MAGNPLTRSVQKALGAVLMLTLGWALFLVPAESAQARKCFGKKVNRVVSGDGGKVRLKFKDVAFVSGRNVTVIAKPYSRICAGPGRQILHPGKGRSLTDAGPGDDRIILHKKSNKNKAYGGLGDDYIRGGKGHDFLYGGPSKNPKGASDRDIIVGLGGNDRIFDYTGEGNKLIGGTGSDRIYSLGNAVSDVHGSAGSDFIWFTGGRARNGRLERIFGEQGNDRLRGNEYPTNGPAYIDGGEGDDWAYGTNADDVLLTNSGIKKIRGYGGDDLIVSASKGLATIDGGSGTDTISYATHTPAGNVNFSGVRVELDKGKSLGQTTYKLGGIENVIGSSFDDEITGVSGVKNVIEGGLGNDALIGQGRDGDRADGGLGTNHCAGFSSTSRCNGESPGDTDHRVSLLDINEGGVLTLIGSRSADRISVGYSNGAYRVSVPDGAVPAGLCAPAGNSLTNFNCPAGINTLNGMLIYGNDGGRRHLARELDPQDRDDDDQRRGRQEPHRRRAEQGLHLHLDRQQRRQRARRPGQLRRPLHQRRRHRDRWRGRRRHPHQQPLHGRGGDRWRRHRQHDLRRRRPRRRSEHRRRLCQVVEGRLREQAEDQPHDREARGHPLTTTI